MQRDCHSFHVTKGKTKELFGQGLVEKEEKEVVSSSDMLATMNPQVLSTKDGEGNGSQQSCLRIMI